MKLSLENLSKYDIVVPDCETTGLKWAAGDKAFGIAIAGVNLGPYGEAANIDAAYFDIRDTPRVIEALKIELPRAKRIANHHMKFDAHILRKLGIMVPLDRIDCTMVRAALINENEGEHGHDGFDLDSLGKKYLGEGKDEDIWAELAAMFGGEPTKRAQIKNLARAPARLSGRYAVRDVITAAKLYLWQERELEEQQLRRVHAVERDVLEMLVEVEEQGIRVDEAAARKQSKYVDSVIVKAQADLDRIAGKAVNANSPVQMRALFKVHKKTIEGRDFWFTDRDVLLEDTDGGEASIAKKALETMVALGDERAKAIITLRRYIKANQFLNGHILGFAINGRVYPNYNQTRSENGLGTGPGRFSVNEPAIQQIPARDKEIQQIVRPAFLPEPGEKWACADWKQFEFRWFAHYTKDESILKTYAGNPDADFHKTVADITGIPRNPPYAGAANAKQINLGLVFGMGEGEMAYTMGLDYTSRVDSRGRLWKNAGPKAKDVFTTYHGAIPGVRKLLEQASSIARSRGYVCTILGRRIRFPNKSTVYKAAGLVFQGTSADCLKVKMVQLHRLAKVEGFRYLSSVHDENNTSIPTKQVKSVVPKIRSVLETFEGDIACRVPIRCSIEVEANWGLASAKD